MCVEFGVVAMAMIHLNMGKLLLNHPHFIHPVADHPHPYPASVVLDMQIDRKAASEPADDVLGRGVFMSEVNWPAISSLIGDVTLVSFTCL